MVSYDPLYLNDKTAVVIEGNSSGFVIMLTVETER
jgi:hypothetical protein